MMNKTLDLLKFSAAMACAAILAFGSATHADTFTGLGDGTSWEDPANWLAGVVPLNNSSPIIIFADHNVEFDADTWAALTASGNLQNATEHRIARLLMGDTTAGAANGTHSLTMDQGAGNTVRATNGTSAVFGSRPGKFSTLNLVSGITNIEAGRFRVGQGADSSATINLNGGELILGRGGLELASIDGSGGDGTLNIFGGRFLTRNDVEIFNGGVFNVEGSVASEIGIGTEGSTDGRWVQEVGGVLRLGFDAGGVTTILIDENDGVPGTGGDGTATFAAGSILDLVNLGGFNTTGFVTVMTAEGGITGAPTLSPASVAAGWQMQIVGNDLQVQSPGGVGPVLKGDVNLDGGVTFLDINPFILLLASNGFQAEADCDCDGDLDFLDIQPFINILANAP